MLEKYLNVFKETFDISAKEAETLNYQDISAWDSVGHMQLVALLEDTFDIMLDTDDIIAFNSFDKGKEIMRKYGIEV